ncbi:hypothetical protein R5R35_011593 [Gryllus longicercus]|uniref:Very-long-chain 3-oxoacyl-CoA synthase n=1 Tax=Gryllus longicercus TaxID=2509291 RepID=A0AAN9VGZ7_9ORTH
MTRPFTVMGLVAAYALFATRLGPWMMRDRKPFELKRTLIVYNALQIVANAYGFYMVRRLSLSLDAASNTMSRGIKCSYVTTEVSTNNCNELIGM